ncbi:MAG: hypothetical protein A2W03_07735 [Candidatus Aminicenantes bacterium RBG_16_63_16]|nr:MAG: hypothetical protein A2W03_07735 [Candidatus Aminicenantes bacterium RBG_16_63_16]
MNRREFLNSTAAALAFSAWPAAAKPNPEPATGLGLFFDPRDLPRIRRSWSWPLFKDLRDGILTADLASDELFLDKELDPNNQLRHLSRAAGILQRESFAYLMTDQKRRLELARLAIEKVLSFSAWDYFMEAGTDIIGLQRAPETAIAMSLALDWLSPHLDDSTKKRLRDQIAEKGCLPCFRTLFGMRHPQKVVGWSFAPWVKLEARDFSRWPVILDKTNLKAIPISGLAVGAMTLEPGDPRMEEWLEMARHGYETIAGLYERDGSYPEGGSYGDYTTFHLLLTQAVIERKLGVDLFDRLNYNGFVEFMLSLQLPHTAEPKACVNFGDAGSGLQSAVSFYVARKTGDGLAQYMGVEHPREHNPFSVIWHQPEVVVHKPDAAHHLKHWDLDWLIYRTGYDLDDLVVAMRSGGPANHEHADRNSILLKAYGEVLLADSKHPTYDHNNAGWVLRSSPAHNTVLIDNQGHQYHDGREGTNASLAEARIIRSGRRDGFVYWTSDATPAYQLVLPDVDRVLRSVFIFSDAPIVVIIDRLTKKNQPSVFSAHWHVENSDGRGSVEVSKDAFVMRRPAANFYARCVSSIALNITAEKMPVPTQVGVHPYARVGTSSPSKEHTLMTVGVACRSGQAPPVIALGEQGSIRIQADSGVFQARVNNIDQSPFMERI